MMTIEQDDHKTEWHVGDKLPEITGRFVSIYADGHELQWLQLALDVGKAEADKDYYKRVWGVFDARNE